MNRDLGRTAPSGLLLTLVPLILFCTSFRGDHRDVVLTYLHAPTLDAALAVLAPNYRIWFESKDGPGMKRERVAELLTWDYALDPETTIRSIEIDGNVVTATTLEQNDFSRLLGHPGWRARQIFTIDEHGMIESQLWIPLGDQPSWRDHLEPAMEWLQTNHPDELERIYPDRRLVRNAETARTWVMLLSEWRDATSDPTLD